MGKEISPLGRKLEDRTLFCKYSNINESGYNGHKQNTQTSTKV